MPMKVVLDTNVYTSDKARNRQEFTTLGNLCMTGHVELVLPFIVKREFETQLDVDATELVTKFERASKRLAGGPIPEDIRADLDSVIAKVKTRKDEVVGSYKGSFSAWLQKHAVIELELAETQAMAAMKSYFVGGPPFKSLKNRDDIPDAMIYQSLIDLASQEPLVFVSKDVNLGQSLSKIAEVTHYKDLNGLIASDAVQAILAEKETEELLARLQRLSSAAENPLTDFVSEHGGENLAGTSFQSASIPGDDREAYIYMFGNLDSVELDWTEAAYHGDRIFVVPFSGEGHFNINYYVPKWDVVDIEHRGASYSVHNDYVVEADEEALIFVTGTLRIKVSADYTPDSDIEDEIEEMTIDSTDTPILAEDAQ